MPLSPSSVAPAKIVVWGMHRSGTSLLCTLLASAGVYFGGESELIPANEENPKGFWEHLGVRNLNNQLLYASQSDWDYVSNFDISAIPPREVRTFEKEAAALLAKLDEKAFLTAIKEPRICLLYPFWRPLLPAAAHLFVYRHPAEIAQSLHRRNGIPYEVGLALCEYYLAHALRNLGTVKCLFLDHQQLLHKPLESLQRVTLHLEKNHALPALQINPDEVSRLVDLDYYRAKHHDMPLPASLNAFWQALKGEDPRRYRLAMSDKTLATLREFDAQTGFRAHIEVKDLRHTNEGLNSSLDLLGKQYARSKQTINDLHEIRARQKQLIDHMQTENSKLREEINNLRML